MRQRKPTCLGDLVAAAFDAAGNAGADERKASYLAACAVKKVLVRTGRLDLARRLASEQSN